MAKKPRQIGIVGNSLGKTTAPNFALINDDRIARKSIEELAASVSSEGISVEVCRPPVDASGLKALFDAVEPFGPIDEEG